MPASVRASAFFPTTKEAGTGLGLSIVRKIVDVVTGVVLVAFGVHLATERR